MPRLPVRPIVSALACFLFLSDGAIRIAVASSSSQAGHWTEASLNVAGIERWYRLLLPPEPPDPAPLVLLLHGGTQSMRKIFGEKAGGTAEWENLAREEKFVLLVPNATNSRTGDGKGDRQNWNDIRGPEVRGAPSVDDVRFLKALLDEIESHYRIDKARVYVTGASNGGMMTFRLLIEVPERFAAGAAFIANLPVESGLLKTPSSPTPLMIANATKDPLIQWEGGELGRGRGLLRATEETVSWWLEANRAEPENPQTGLLPDRDPDDGCRIRMASYPARDGGAPVLFYTMEGGGHAMPSMTHEIPNNFITRRLIGNICRDAEGARLAWEFLRKYRRSPASP